MEETPFGFFWLLLGVFLAALVLTIALHLFKQRKLRRLKDPRNDYYRFRE